MYGSFRSKARYTSLIGLLAGASCFQLAHAEEFVTPVFPGLTIGIPAGASLPQGVYSSTTLLDYRAPLVNGAGQRTGIDIDLQSLSQTFIYSTGLTFLGAQYSLYANQFFEHIRTYADGSPTDAYGVFNTFLSPINLSWSLGNGFYASYADSFYLPDATYAVGGPTIGNHFFTFEQNFGLSYLKDGYNFTAFASLDINATNPTTNYHSGNVIEADFTATKTIGKFTLGIGGYVTEQFQDDKLNGLTVAASDFNSYGNRWQEVAVGPYVKYDLGPATISAYFTQDVFARNAPKAGVAWLRLDVPLFGFASKEAARPAPIKASF